MATIKLSIREFALPSPRSGSIDSHSGFGRATLEGIEIHQNVQRRRKIEDSRYQSEIKLARTFERAGYEFQVEGRMDGIFFRETPLIEEIKSSSNIHELLRNLEERPVSHPYCLQLLTYGYFFHLENQILPSLSFHLVSTRDRKTLDHPLTLDIAEYETWMERRLDELVLDAQRAEKRTARRKKIAAHFPFPFEDPRPGQIELMESVEIAMVDRKRLLVQAPTGLGKTVGVLYPSLKEALNRGQRVVYVTPKNSQHSVAEDAVARFQEKGSNLKSLTITAKSKMCMKAEPLCNPSYCEYAKNYYDKVAENDLIEKLAKKKQLTARVFKKMAEDHEVCPFELQLDASPEADTIICDYNYVFAPESALRRLQMSNFAQEGKPNLVIDEAHNLPSRTMGYYSPSLSVSILERMRDDFRDLSSRRFRQEAEELLDECIRIVKQARPEKVPQQIDPDLDPFIDQDVKLGGFLSRYLDADVEILPKDPVLRLCFYWGGFTEILTEIQNPLRPEFFITYQEETIKITCCDASQIIQPCYDDYQNIVGFSATLKPFDFYSRLIGFTGDTYRTKEFQSPFDPAKRKLLIIPQVSTKYSERQRNYHRIAEAIHKIAKLKPGNYFAFFPSFAFMEEVLSGFDHPPGFNIRRQERHSSAAQTEVILDELRTSRVPTLVFAVQGGVFSEGVDYPGDMLIGAFVIGPPLPHFDIEREGMRKYYDEHYRKGFDYAYTYPAMAKAVQAAGRVIRSSDDKGVIILMDNRFLEQSYSQSMPGDWFKESPLELVSKSILNEVAEFWLESPTHSVL